MQDLQDQQRRVLSLWFPRLAAERALRAEPELAEAAVAVVAEVRNALVLANLTWAAEAAGLRRGMALGDARAILPGLVTRPADAVREAAFLTALRRWAGRFTPWVGEEGAEGLVLDVTGCARVFGGEAGLVAEVEAGAAELGLTLRLGLADTPGAAWAVARYAGAGHLPAHAGDAIDQEARATRSRAQKRRWERGGPPPAAPSTAAVAAGRIVPVGETLARIGSLPVAALRLEPGAIAVLGEMGLRQVIDLTTVPRAQLARRAGPAVPRRLDQALGRAPEPVSPARPPHVFAVRLTLPEPIGLEADVLAGIDRLLPALCDRLAAAGQGARRVRLTLVRTDGRPELREVGLARPAARPEAIRPLLALKLGAVDAGFGIEVLRLEATLTEALGPQQARRGAGRGGSRRGGRARRPARPARRPARARGAGAAASRRQPHPGEGGDRDGRGLQPARAGLAGAGGGAAGAALPARAAGAVGRGGAARPLHLAAAALPQRRRLRPGADRPGMVARRPGLALRGARLLAGRDRGRHPALALRGQGRRARRRAGSCRGFSREAGGGGARTARVRADG